MKKLPRKTKHWASEAFEALEQALQLFSNEFPRPTDDEKMSLVSFAVPLAAMHRGIDDNRKIEQANEQVLAKLATDMQAARVDEDIAHSICFLIAYMDAHVSFGHISEKKVDDIMLYLSDHYEINIPLASS